MRQKLISLFPDDESGYSFRFHAFDWLDAPPAQLGSAGDDLLRVARPHGVPGATFIAAVADAYVKHGIFLDRVPSLIEEIMSRFDDPEAVVETDLSPNLEIAERSRMELIERHVSALVTLSECYEKGGQMEKARSVVTPIPAYLASKAVGGPIEHVPSTTLDRDRRASHAYAEHSYWLRLAAIDEHEGNRESALINERQALLLWDGGRDRQLAKQRQQWKSLGRSDEDWQAWVDSIPPPSWRGQQLVKESTFAPTHRALPRVVLKDLAGVEWPPDRFANKTTVVVVWATWCKPCVAELPYVAKLAERLSGRRDVQVISFNVDGNPLVAEQFIVRQGLKFPVLDATNFAEDLMPFFAIPRTWIIRDGVIVEESVGFDLPGDQWVEQVADRLK